MKTLLSFQNVSAHYEGIQALNKVTLEVYQREIVALIGANGAGKSTLLMSVYGHPRVSQGKIIFQDKEIHLLPTHQIASLGISIAPERRRIFEKMTTHENLLMGAYTEKNDNKTKQNLHKVYHLFPLLKERQHQRAGTLSGGEQQMLAIGRSLMSTPMLFLLDEPSLGLAPQLVSQIFNALKEVADAGTTILLVEQHAYHALNLANRGYVLANGEIQMSGNANKLLNHPDVQAAYLGIEKKSE